ncbi:MAG: hypothetical protein DWG76_04130 [Chloroflexi bacterium]|nr:hypothetical protein [Chloroflexota bacterium]
MEVKFVDNQSEKLSDLLIANLGKSVDTRIAVAFASQSGLRMLADEIDNALAAIASIEILVGLDYSTTEAKALWAMQKWSKDFENFNFYCFPRRGNGIYHPKMYLLLADNGATIVVGSSNLTAAGLSQNAEANILIKEGLDSEVVSDALASYVRLKFSNRFAPTDEYLSMYEEASRQRVKAEKQTDESAKLSALEKSMRELESTIPRPRASKKDLVGWLEMVYDSLPDGNFSTTQMYEYEEEFSAHYPENNNVRAKIRQQLQYLRDIDLVEHISTNNWRKL